MAKLVNAPGSPCSPSPPFVLGITGPIASGKSTVSRLLEQYGAHIIDADEVYRSLVSRGSPLWRAIRERFGDAVIGDDGELDRAALGRIVFSNPESLAELDALTHPTVVAEIRRRVAATTAPVVVIEAIKLIEAGLASDVDALWLVTAEPDTRVSRLMARNGLNRQEAERRVRAASAILPTCVTPDATIDNTGNESETRLATGQAWQELIAATCEASRDDRGGVEKPQ